MKNFSEIIELFSELEIKLANKPLLISVRRGLTYMIPVLLLGSMALVFLSLPIPAYQKLMYELFGDSWKGIFQFLRDGTFNIMALLMVLCISYSYVTEHNAKKENNISPIIAAVVSLSSLISLMNINMEKFVLSSFGVLGVFLAILVGVAAPMIFVKLSAIESLKIKAYTDGADETFQSVIMSIFPAAITILIFAAINQGLIVAFGISNIQVFLTDSLTKVFSNIHSPFWGALLFIFLVQLFWFFGLHGSNVLEPVAQMIFASALYRNQICLSVGQKPTEIFTKTFFDSFVLMGGCGSAICLVLALLIFGRNKSLKSLAKLSIVPIFFNINELIVFGIPVVLNPIFFIPFICVPLVLTIISYVALITGLVPYTIHAVEWTTPVFLSGYQATGSIKGSLLQLLNLTIGVLCYLPFIKLSEKVSDVQVKRNLQKVYNLFNGLEGHGGISTLLTRQDEIGNIARVLLADLKDDLKNKKINLFYQPQVNFSGQIVGVETLLRWKHRRYGYIYPPLVIALAEAAQFISELGNLILENACRDMSEMGKAGAKDVVLSVNVSSLQLENADFANTVEFILRKHSLEARCLAIEITEQVALSNSNQIFEQLKTLKKMGVKLAMDDFGMGHSSLMYLKEYDFDIIKLDGALVRELLTNGNCSNIISSIVFLGKSLDYKVVAEYVEEEAQRHKLHELGCDEYQGYLYSKALPLEEVVDYIQSKK